MFTPCEMTAEMSIQIDEWRSDFFFFSARKEVWDFSSERWDEKEADGQGDGP